LLPSCLSFSGISFNLLQPDSFSQRKETNADWILFYDAPQDSATPDISIYRYLQYVASYGVCAAAVRQRNENDVALLDVRQ